jgi:hypothetical protein
VGEYSYVTVIVPEYWSALAPANSSPSTPKASFHSTKVSEKPPTTSWTSSVPIIASRKYSVSRSLRSKWPSNSTSWVTVSSWKSSPPFSVSSAAARPTACITWKAPGPKNG